MAKRKNKLLSSYFHVATLGKEIVWPKIDFTTTSTTATTTTTTQTTAGTTTSAPLICPRNETRIVSSPGDTIAVSWLMPMEDSYRKITSKLGVGIHRYKFELSRGVTCYMVINIQGEKLQIMIPGTNSHYNC